MKKLILFFAILCIQIANSQIKEDENLSPGGLLDNVFDNYGNKYKLSDIQIEKKSQQSKVVYSTCTSGIFELHFTAGSGMVDGEHPDAAARRAVVCQVFSDLSNFINTPLHSNNQRVHIWIRDIGGFVSNPSTSNVLGIAGSFNVLPAVPTATTVTGGITDNEIWKTIHTGVDSYTNVVSPLALNQGSQTGSGSFYHGFVAINFSNNVSNNGTGVTPGYQWYTGMGTTPSGFLDLYTVVLHEVTHALGFASFFDNLGTSRIGTGYNYFSRYDQFLKNSNDQFLLTTNSSCPLYNNTFNTVTDNLHPNCLLTDGLQTGNGVDHTQSCTNTIRYISTINNIPVYTPQCFEIGSSLSHFEDECYTNNLGFPNGNNEYFVMSNANDDGVAKRFLKPEERNALCDMGYSVQTTYGNTANSNHYDYGGTLCGGIRVAGVNDGIINTGPNINQYAYTGSGTTASPIVIPINGIGGILTNDVYSDGTNADIRVEFLQDIYDVNARFNTTLTSFSSTTSVAFINFTSAVPGLHLLRYVPVVNGIRGNITYVYVFVSDFQCVKEECSIISNGSLESSQCGQLNSNGFLGTLDCWQALNATPDVLETNCGLNGYLMSNQFINIHDSPNPSNNSILRIQSSNNSAGIFSEAIQNLLSSPLTPGQSYIINFWYAVRRSFINSTISPCRIDIDAFDNFQVPTMSSYGSISTIFPNAHHLVDTLAIATPLQSVFETWHQVSIPFTYNGSTNRNVIAISVSNNLFDDNIMLFIDDISITPVNVAFNLPPFHCINQTFPDLTTFLTPILPGGTFTLNGSTITSFTPTVAGNYTINYTYENNIGCPITISDAIEVLPASSPLCSSCQDNITLTSPDIEDLYERHLWIRAQDNYSVSANQNVALRAGQFIELMPNTSYETSQVFEAYILDCASFRKSFENDTTSKGGINLNSEIAIFPNPSSSSIEIRMKNNKFKSISIVSLEGKKIYETSFESTESVNVDISNYANGMYIVNVFSEDGQLFTKKLIKN